MLTRNTTLQTKILGLFLLLLLVVQGVSFFFTYRANLQLENTQLNNRINNARDVFETQVNNRRYYLSSFAQTVAQDYGLKSVLNEDDRSFVIALNNHRKRIDSDLAVAIDKDGEVFANLVTSLDSQGNNKVKVDRSNALNLSVDVDDWQSERTQLVQLDNNLYQLSIAPIQSGSRTVGWIGFGYSIDTQLAQELENLTDVHIAFFIESDSGHSVVGTSDAESYPLDSLVFETMRNGNQASYLYSFIDIGSVKNQPVTAVLFESKADLLKNLGIQWPRLILLIAITLMVSTLGAVLVARGVTRPIKSLVSQVKGITQGNYDGSVDVTGSQELQQLSAEFNHMKEAIVSREKTISFQAFHDGLTHLPNRNSLINELQQRAEQNQHSTIIQLCYLGAEDIADTLGHRAGEEVLLVVANRVKNLKPDLAVYHLGSEHFVILADASEDIKSLVDELQSALSVQCQFNNVNLNLQFAFGVVLSRQHEVTSAAELLQKSNVAIQHAIRNKQRVQIYDPLFDQDAMERLFLTNSLKQAIDNNELTLFFQPKLSLDNMTVSHAEALVRWQHPKKGLIPPDAFIGIAEKTGLMNALSRWVAKSAFEHFSAWRKKGYKLCVAINISAQNLLDKSLSDYLISLKEEYQVADNMMTLEVTEDAVVEDISRAAEILLYLQQHGFKLSIDDYGTGYSSLAQLKQLPMQELKIDRSFVQNLMVDDNDQIIVSSTVKLAHTMGLSVVAEGVEDKDSLDWLAEHGCQLAQGFYISKPLPSDLFEQWLHKSGYAVRKSE